MLTWQLLGIFAALWAGPPLYALARRSNLAGKGLDAFVLASIVALVVLGVIPETVRAGGYASTLFVLAGLFGPTVIEHAFHRREREAHIGTLALAMAGFVLHAVGDGAVLAPGVAGAADHALAWAIILHSLPVGVAIWWLLAPAFGGLWPSLALLAMCAATALGYRLGLGLEELVGARAWGWLQALVAGSILHVLFGRPHLRRHAHRH